METIELRVVPHTSVGKEMIEVWRDGELIAGVYPHLDGIRVVSKYLTGTYFELALPPSVIIKLAKDW